MPSEQNSTLEDAALAYHLHVDRFAQTAHADLLREVVHARYVLYELSSSSILMRKSIVGAKIRRH
jgi:hypothetical protein